MSNYRLGQKVLVNGTTIGTYSGYADFKNEHGKVVMKGLLIKLEDGRKVVFAEKYVQPLSNNPLNSLS